MKNDVNNSLTCNLIWNALTTQPLRAQTFVILVSKLSHSDRTVVNRTYSLQLVLRQNCKFSNNCVFRYFCFIYKWIFEWEDVSKPSYRCNKVWLCPQITAQLFPSMTVKYFYFVISLHLLSSVLSDLYYPSLCWHIWSVILHVWLSLWTDRVCCLLRAPV